MLSKQKQMDLESVAFSTKQTIFRKRLNFLQWHPYIYIEIYKMERKDIIAKKSQNGNTQRIDNLKP